MKIDLPRDIERAVDGYRQARKAETGKVIMRHTAVTELLRKALQGVEPPKPLAERVGDLERRVAALETEGEN